MPATLCQAYGRWYFETPALSRRDRFLEQSQLDPKMHQAPWVPKVPQGCLEYLKHHGSGTCKRFEPPREARIGPAITACFGDIDLRFFRPSLGCREHPYGPQAPSSSSDL
jgi:hypothetical protein